MKIHTKSCYYFLLINIGLEVKLDDWGKWGARVAS
jgi:hypothetical protein